MDGANNMTYEERELMLKSILKPVDYVSSSTNKYRKSELLVNLFYLIKYKDIVISDRNEYDVCVRDIGLIEDEGLSPKEVINENLNWLYGFADIEQIEDDIYIKFNDEFNELKKSHDSMFKSFSGLENIFKDFGIKYSSIRLGDIEKNQGDIVIINLSNKELLESALDKYFEDVRLNIWINDKNTCKYRIETNGIYTNIYYNPLYISSWINTSIDKYADRKKLLLSYGYSI